MRKFILKLLLVLSVPVLFIVFSYVFWLNGYIDPFYVRISSPQKSSMILGTSRASMGIVPCVLESNGYVNVYNFGFTIGVAPWGESYYNSICKKLDTTRNDGLFVLSIDPFSISSFFEKDGTEYIPPTFLSDLNSVTATPNWGYLYQMDVKPWRYLLNLMHLEKSDFFIHDDGWGESLRVWDAETEKEETPLKLNEYKNNFSNSKLSYNRLGYLEKTIIKLRPHGRVVLVRIPTSAEMYDFECEYMPSFDSLIMDLEEKYNVEYYNFQNKGAYRTYDGNHLIPEDAKRFTQELCDSLKRAR